MAVVPSSQVSAAAESAAPRFPWLKAADVTLLVGALLFMLLAGLFSMRHESPMQDEVVHVPAGVAYWQRRDARLNLEHPLLIKLLAAAPVLLLHPQADYHSPSWAEAARDYQGQWGFGNAFFSVWNRDAPAIIFWARLPMLAVGLGLGLLLWWIGCSLGGRWGGVLSLVVYVTSPFFLANSPIVTTDVGVTLFVLASAWMFASVWGTPTGGRAMALGALLAGAFLSKYSSGLLLPALGGAGLWLWVRERWRQGPFRHRRLERRRLAMLGLGLWVAAGLVYLVSLPFMWNTPALRACSLGAGHSARLRPWLAALQGWLEAHPAWTHLLMPPLLYARGLGEVLASLKRPMFLLGHHYAEGHWFYFPVLFWYKMAPGFLLLLGLLAVLLAWRWRARRRAPCTVGLLEELSPGFADHGRVLLVTLAVFAGAAMASHLDIGLRHFSVPIALLMGLVAWLPPLLRRLPALPGRATAVGLVALLLMSCLFTAVSVYPNYLAYFNVLRGSRPGWQIAADSNLDWGQSLPSLRKFMLQRGIEHISLDSFGSLNRAVYIPGYTPWRCERTRALPSPWVAVSAGQLAAFTDPPSSCAWLFRYPHWSLAGGSLYVFQRPPPAQ